MEPYVEAVSNTVLENLSLNYNRPKDFIICQWQEDQDTVHPLFLRYRWFHASYFIITQTYVLVFYDPLELWWIFLTSWAYTLCVAQSIVAAAIITAYNSGKEKALEWYKTYWLLHTLSLDAAYFVTIMYWTSVHEATDVITASTIIVHGANVVMMTIDFALVAHPMNLLHCYYVVIFGLTYYIFSALYYLKGGTGLHGTHYIYKILDWSKPLCVVDVLVTTIGLMVMKHVYMWTFYKIRKFIHHLITPKQQTEIIQTK